MRHSGIKSLHTVLPSTWISFYDVLKKINVVNNLKKYIYIVVKVLRAKVNPLYVVAFNCILSLSHYMKWLFLIRCGHLIK